jgi:hypothetical protein
MTLPESKVEVSELGVINFDVDHSSLPCPQRGLPVRKNICIKAFNKGFCVCPLSLDVAGFHFVRERP